MKVYFIFLCESRYEMIPILLARLVVTNYRIKDDNFGFAVICCLVIVRRIHICIVVDTSKTKIVVFYSLSNAFDLTSGSTIQRKYRSKYFK